MEHAKYPKNTRKRLVLASIFISALIVSVAQADVIATVNDVDIEGSVFEFYLESRLQKPLAQVTAEERDLVLQELGDIYALTTQKRATELSRDPRFLAQVELQYRAALAQLVASDWLNSNPATEEEIQEAYNSQAALGPSLQFKARHILVETQSAAMELIAQLDSGAVFEELAQANSVGESGPTGGELGWFSPSDMVAPFADAVAALEDGAYTKSPVQTEFGWHVILREDSRKNEAPPLESVRDSLKSNVEQGKFQRYLEQLRTIDGNSD
ncbi:MAG: peptidylprolyl isomerase [Proteobacteria bacterium]|nr:peptidylprolyl isomerase [Pseudomonadota bacterium]